jgi:hypothetical protein
LKNSTVSSRVSRRPSCRYGGAGQLRVQGGVHPELGRRREVQQFLEFGHVVDLAAALQDVHPLLGGDDRVAIEVGAPLLKFGEILHRF